MTYFKLRTKRKQKLRRKTKCSDDLRGFLQGHDSNSPWQLWAHPQSRRWPAVPLTVVTLVLRPVFTWERPVTSSLQPQQGAWHVVDLEGGSSLTRTDHTDSIGPFENPM